MTQSSTTSSANITRVVDPRLRRLRGKITSWFLVDGLARVLLAALFLIGFDFLIDWTFHMDRPQRIVMLALCVLGLGFVSFRRLFLPMSHELSDDALCLQVEDRNKQLGQTLISAFQFARIHDFESRGVSTAMVDATIAKGAAGAEKVIFEQVIDRNGFAKNMALLVAMVLSLSGVAVGASVNETMGIWGSRFFILSDDDYPQDIYWDITGLKNDTLTIPRGDDYTLVAVVKEDSLIFPTEAVIDIRTSAGERSEQLEQQENTDEDKAGEGKAGEGKEREFLVTLSNVIEEFEFRIRSGRSNTKWYQVVLIDRPSVDELQLHVTPPEYVGTRTVTLPPGKGPYGILRGSQLKVSGSANKELSSATLILGGVSRKMNLTGPKQFEFMVSREQLKSLADNPDRGGTCQIELTDTEQIQLPGRSEPGPLRSKRPTTFTIKIKKDLAPVVQAKLDGISSMVVPGARIPLIVKIMDEYEISDVRLSHTFRTEDSSTPPVSGVLDLEELDTDLDQRWMSFHYIFELSPLEVPTGSGLSFKIEADDNDNISGPNTGVSTTFLLRVVSEDELRIDLLRREKEQRQEFERLLKTQENVQLECRAMLADVNDKESLTIAERQSLMKLQKRQKLLGSNLENIARRFEAIVVEILNNRLEKEGGTLQKRLSNEIIQPIYTLVYEPIPECSAKLDHARRQSADSAKRNQAFDDAIKTQQTIIDSMKDILKHMVKAEGYQEAVNLLFEIRKVQEDVLGRTEERAKQRIRDLIEKGEIPKKKPDEGEEKSDK